MNRRLHPLFDEEGAIGAESGVEVTPAAEVETIVETVTPTGVEDQGAAEPEKQNNYEKAFAKRLSAEREKWEKDTGEKYKDHETLRKAAEFFQKHHGYTDLMTMNEDIELAELQKRAAENDNISPAMQKRMETLEAKAAKGDELEQKQQENQRVAEYFSNLNEFVKDKGVDPLELNKFMMENELQYNPNDMTKSFNLALKAFKSDDAIAKLETAKKDAVNEYLASKKGVKVEGAPGTASVQAVDTRKMTSSQLEKHVLERFKAATTPQ